MQKNKKTIRTKTGLAVLFIFPPIRHRVCAILVMWRYAGIYVNRNHVDSNRAGSILPGSL